MLKFAPKASPSEHKAEKRHAGAGGRWSLGKFGENGELTVGSELHDIGDSMGLYINRIQCGLKFLMVIQW